MKLGEPASARGSLKDRRRKTDPDQNVAALGRILDAGQADGFDLADRHAAKFHRRADVEPLHRLVDIGFDQDFLLKNRADAERDHANDADDRANDDEYTDLEVAGFFHTGNLSG